jgi:hypothetical protein
LQLRFIDKRFLPKPSARRQPAGFFSQNPLRPRARAFGPVQRPAAGSTTSADQSESYWSYLFDCKRKEKTTPVTGFSGWTFTPSNTMTEEKARDLVRRTGASEYFIEMTSGRVMRVARSGPWKVGRVAMMLTAGAIGAYQWSFCA